MKHIMSFLSAMLIGAVMYNVSAGDFTSTDLTVFNPEAEITLGATVTAPADGKPRAGIVLATGSGQQNRDEEILGHRPFKVLAEYLSAHGYAVIRMDDRGVGESGGDPSVMTVDDYVSDLSAGIAKLDSCFPGFIPMGVIGHSEGGTAAIKMANGEAECDFIVTLAAPAWQGDSIIMSQGRAMSTAMTGRWDGEATQRQILNLVKSPLNDNLLKAALYVELGKTLGDAMALPAVKEQLDAQINVLCSPAYRAMVRYNPADDISRIDIPWLALNGQLDLQVLPGNLDTIGQLNPKAETRLLPRHNHLFQTCTTGMIQEYATIPEDISEETLKAILTWLDRTTSRINLNR